MDPQIKVRTEQLCDWLGVWGYLRGEHGHKLRPVWARLRGQLADAHTRWRRVKGHLSATIATLYDLDWVPERPDRWIDHSGLTWEWDGSSGLGILYHAIADAALQPALQTAAKLHCGQGLAGGINMLPAYLNFAKYQRNEQAQREEVLTAVLTGRIWTQARK